jgi:hypothetical protein
MANILYDNGKKTEFIDNGSDVIVKQTQDISGIIEFNKAQYNETDSRARWGNDAIGSKVASIPLTVFQDLEKKGITRGFTILDHKRFKEFLNNPDNVVFRTRAGRI